MKKVFMRRTTQDMYRTAEQGICLGVSTSQKAKKTQTKYAKRIGNTQNLR